MSEIYMVQVVRYVATMFWMPSTCTQHIYCTSYKQCHGSQKYSDHNKTWVRKPFWSYLGQFSTVFYVSGTEINRNMYGNVVQLTL